MSQVMEGGNKGTRQDSKSLKKDSTLKAVIKATVGVLQKIWPLESRKRFVVWVDPMLRFRWGAKLSFALLSDWRKSNPKSFHKFFWSHHLFEYGRSYESPEHFETEGLEASRKLFLADLENAIENAELSRSDHAPSVLELGCSLGYLLNSIEVELLPCATRMVGIDLDSKAIEIGRDCLARKGSRVVLEEGDLEELDRIVGQEPFDLTIAAGVLSYLDESDARQALAKIFRHTSRLIALAGLGNKVTDNRNQEESEQSPERYDQWVHNFDRMISDLGGRVIGRRWEGAKLYNGQTVYFVFAVPGD
jgi:SAM-dependent methyltransferase